MKKFSAKLAATSISLLLLLPFGCKNSSDEPASKQETSPPATVQAQKTEANVPAPPPVEYPVECSSNTCKVTTITEKAIATLKAQKDQEKLIVKFREGATDDNFATIVNFPEIRAVSIASTKITDLSPLKKLKDLKSLTLSQSSVKDLSPLAGLTSLEEIEMRSLKGKEADGKATVIDLAPLSEMVNLTVLKAYGTHVKNESALAKSTKMVELDFYMSEIKEISFVKNMPDLEVLDLYADKLVTDLSPLTGLKKLRDLNLYMTRATDLSVLNTLPALEKVWIQFSTVKDLSFLQNAHNLRELAANWCKDLTDISALAGKDRLKDLGLDDTKVADLRPLQGLKSLERLNLGGTAVTEISPVAGLVALKYLDMGEVKVTDLSPLKGLIALNTLELSKSTARDLTPLQNLANLKTLKLSTTQVEDIAPLAGLVNLTELDLQKTAVKDFNALSALKSLRYLDLAETQVKNLDFAAQMPELYKIDVSKTPVDNLQGLYNLPKINGVTVSKTVSEGKITELKSKQPKVTVTVVE
ncbi:MAG: leucine-rich repeat domain-containing protein [Pseudomonadota bacterium]